MAHSSGETWALAERISAGSACIIVLPGGFRMKHTLGFAAVAACTMLGSGCAVTHISPIGFGPPPSGYTCCNLHHVDGWISDGNWSESPIIPAGAPIKVTGYGSNRVY